MNKKIDISEYKKGTTIKPMEAKDKIELLQRISQVTFYKQRKSNDNNY